MLNTVRPVSVRVDVGPVLPGQGSLAVAADIFVPNAPPRVLLFCLPGGGVNRQYFNMGGPGNSFAQAMLAHDAVVVTLDHLGVGDSDEPDDRFCLTADNLMRANTRACAAIRQGLCDGTLDPLLPPLNPPLSIGVGHSMGAMLTVVQHAANPTHAALALLCFSTRGLPEVLTDAEKLAATAPDHGRSQAEHLARTRFVGDPSAQAPRPEGTSPAAAALAPVQDKMLQTSAMQSMLPNNVSAEAALIDVPIYLGVGERDITGRPHRIPASFPACRDIALYVVQGAGHHPFVAAKRHDFFAHIGDWVDTIVTRHATTA